MSDLKKLQYTIESCNHCGQCKWLMPSRMKGWDFAPVCPIHDYYGFDAYSGQGFLNIAGEILQGKLSCSERLSEMLHACTACGACDVNCKCVRDMEVLDTIYELRKCCAEEGYLPENCKKEAENIRIEHNIYGLPHGNRFAGLPEEEYSTPDADTVLFVGCSVYQHPETALAAMKILRAGGVKFRLLCEEEWCCGASLWRSGQHAEAEKLIHRNIERFRALNVKTVITTCAECFGTFRNGYPRFEKTDFNTVHISQVAAELLREGKLRFREDGDNISVTYHDPCMLGRCSEEYVPWQGEIRSWGLLVPEKKWCRGEFGVYEPPRELLRAMPGVTLTEMPRTYEEAWCCGGNAAAADKEFADYTADERLREAKASGAEAIVSSCPFCRDNLSGRENGLPYFDLTEMMADRLEKEGEV